MFRRKKKSEPTEVTYSAVEAWYKYEIEHLGWKIDYAAIDRYNEEVRQRLNGRT